ncbi:vWA domain-containing protein [Thiolapillus sp.]
MPDGGFHFAQPLWLLALLAIPLIWLWLRYSRTSRQRGRESLYADEHLLPWLTGEVRGRSPNSSPVLAIWGLTWMLMVLAMAGPRWDYERISAFRPAAELVVLLDISASMNIRDVRPSRLARAKQEIQDLLRLNQGLRIGLVAFATVAHVVSPLTEDMQTLKRTLPSLSTDLVKLSGSRLGNALDKAVLLLQGDNKNLARHILLITDGDFDEPGLSQKVDQLREQNIHLHILALGTDGGGLVPERYVSRGLRTPISRLNEAQLKTLASRGDGLYQLAGYQENDTRKLLNRILADAEQQQLREMPTRVWNERFYLFLIPVIFLVLYLFGRSNRFSRRLS